MLPASHRPRCIYCLFKARQYSLAIRRLPNHVNLRREKAAQENAPSKPIRYHGSNKGRAEPQVRFSGRVGDNGVIRKFLDGRIDAKSPQEQAREFRDVLSRRLAALKDELQDAPLMEALAKEREAEGLRPRSFNAIWNEFEKKLMDTAKGPIPYFGEDAQNKPVLQDLKDAYKQRKEKGLDGRIKYHFYGHLTGSRFTKSDIRNQQMLADLRYPSEWFPATRSMHRSIHLHVGPTNSGKTYHALQRLEKADTGVYAGPLRLLAHEVYTRLNAKGKKCSLVTGEERRSADEAENSLGKLSSCTVEMVPLNTTVDVAVIDEIQMLGNKERGWAWTQALLGVKAREVHLCGEERTVPLVQQLCASVGDKLQIHRYERLSPLEMENDSLGGDLRKLRKGDCIVSFSVMGIHALRKQIERTTGKKVATVYGSLPPETRAQQARLFNDSNNDYDYLVASDAVGMGLNLAIKRIIFEASSKFDGVSQRTLGVADIKQIAGRAGRYRTAHQANEAAQEDREALANEDLAAAKDEPAPTETPTPTPPPAAAATNTDTTGFITTLERFDFPIVRQAMQAAPEPIKTAGLFPPQSVLERFASYFPAGTPFSYILTRLHELSQMHTRFHLCGLKDQIWVADLIEPVRGLTIGDRNIICSSPASSSDQDLWKDLLPAYAKIIAEQSGGNILDIPELPLELLEVEVDASREYLRALERLHKGIVSYLWLSYRFAGVFGTRALAFHVKGLVEEKIELVLGKFSFSETQRRKIAARREHSILKDLAVGEDEDAQEEAGAVEDMDHEDVDEDDVDDELRSEMVFGAKPDDSQLDAQTTLTSGGDHLSGEEDTYEDPAIEAEIAAEKPATSSFAEWRAQQTRGESQGSSDVNPADEGQASLSNAAREGELAAQSTDVETVSEDRPAIADVQDVEAAPQVVKEEAGLENHLHSAPETPETELEGKPLETQEVPPSPVDARISEEDATSTGSAVGANMPLKHLAHAEIDAGEMNRDHASRP